MVSHSSDCQKMTGTKAADVYIRDILQLIFSIVYLKVLRLNFFDKYLFLSILITFEQITCSESMLNAKIFSAAPHVCVGG